MEIHARGIKIMVTKKMLEGYIHSQKEIEEIKRKISRVEEKILKIENEGTVIDGVTGGNGGIQHFKIEGVRSQKHSELRMVLMGYQENLLKREIKAMQIVNDIELFISEIDDALMRRIIDLRFIERLSWQEVADRIGGNTEDSVRMQFERFMLKQ